MLMSADSQLLRTTCYDSLLRTAGNDCLLCASNRVFCRAGNNLLRSDDRLLRGTGNRLLSTAGNDCLLSADNRLLRSALSARVVRLGRSPGVLGWDAGRDSVLSRTPGFGSRRCSD